MCTDKDYKKFINSRVNFLGRIDMCPGFRLLRFRLVSLLLESNA